MKSTDPKISVNIFITIFVVLTFLMLATRTHHFVSLTQLPSASIAVFFLAGMYLRDSKVFWVFYFLSVTIDLASSYYRGQFGDCMTTSYPALVFSYAAMFTVGFYAKPNWLTSAWHINIVKVALALFIGSSIAFFISNGSYYTLSGKFPNLSWLEYSARVDKYYFRSISNPIFYVVSAIVIDFTINYCFTGKARNTHNSIADTRL